MRQHAVLWRMHGRVRGRHETASEQNTGVARYYPAAASLRQRERFLIVLAVRLIHRNDWSMHFFVLLMCCYSLSKHAYYRSFAHFGILNFQLLFWGKVQGSVLRLAIDGKAARSAIRISGW